MINALNIVPIPSFWPSGIHKIKTAILIINVIVPMLKFTLRERVRASYDHENKLVMWSYPSATGTNAGIQNDKIIIYHLASQRWSLVELDHEVIIDYLSPGFTLDELDDYPTSGADDLDAISISLDSAAFIGGLRTLGVFNTSHFLGSFGG